MLDQDNNINLISLNVPVICLLDNARILLIAREKLHVNHFSELKG